MAEDSSDSTLIKIAIFGIVVSILCTAFISVLFVDNGDYDYEDIELSRAELINFSGETMLNQTPWRLTHVYTPWTPEMPTSQVDADGWLYGREVTDYPDLGHSASIKLDPNQKSSRELGFREDAYQYTQQDGYKWWASTFYDSHQLHPLGQFAQWLGLDVNNTVTAGANEWNFTGYRYVFDPMLPFSAVDPDSGDTSVADGSLNIVWYNFNGTEGLSGGLEVYGGTVRLASYTASDIIADYNSVSNYASTYEFNFQGTPLVLSIRFDPAAIESGTALMQAWTQGDWTMAISSPSAGNFFDIDGSTSFTATAGSMIQTFIQIYTFNVPSIDNPWMDFVLWALVGLPMTLAMALLALRLINGFRVI